MRYITFVTATVIDDFRIVSQTINCDNAPECSGKYIFKFLLVRLDNVYIIIAYFTILL